MVVETAGGACEMFFVAYTLDGVHDVSGRPLTFAFNGGPGGCSEWLHLGFLSPRRVSLNSADAWYHGRLDAKYQAMSLESYLDEVRAFAGGDYLQALFRGRSLSEDDFHAVAAQLAAYSGLSLYEPALAAFRTQAEAWYTGD